jgi:hypothetical protein
LATLPVRQNGPLAGIQPSLSTLLKLRRARETPLQKLESAEEKVKDLRESKILAFLHE